MDLSSKIYVLLLSLLVSLKQCHSEREHKVHNIVLYPDRHSWCQTTAIKQIVASPGYEPVTIDNNVCVGACYSYSIPRTQPAEPGELIGPYCDSCKPADSRCYHVTLHDDKNSSKTIQKRVQIITNCSCSSCDRTEAKDCEISDENTSELPSDLFALLHPNTSTEDQSKYPLPELPELLHMSPSEDENHSAIDISDITPEKRFEINAKIMTILKAIQSGDDDSQKLEYDKDQLKELLQIVEGTQHRLDDKNLVEFMNFVKVHNEEDLQLDFSKLNEVVEIFKKSENLAAKHRNFGLGLKIPNVNQDSQKNNEDIERDFETFNRKMGGNLNKNFGIEGSHYGMNPHYKGSHVGMGLHPRVGGISTNLLEDPKDAKKLDDAKKHHHHHAGEEQHLGVDRGHLVIGPHGSLAFSPDANIEEKLNLETHLVKPNHEGTEIEYENHPKRRKRRVK
ncbi:uncharacterized protein LOC108735814 isoform X2 [Agrilus planipennis]|nr:uncharacterized protein LOC108735814 isoform X2 [Agrilus planipennis]XP_018323479.1 uncharacterized protein LOC108735814 isoform X2 [Agrilus planipennis]